MTSPAPATTTAYLDSTAAGTTPTFDPNPSGSRASATVIPRRADLAVGLTVDNPAPNLGDAVTFTVALANGGPDAATGVSLADLLPAGLAFVSAAPSEGTYDPSTGV